MAGEATRRTARSRTVPLSDGRSLHVRSWRGRGPTLVLLHGLLDSAEGWTTFCRATRRPCLAIDLAGFGTSDLPARPSFSAYADDVVAAVEHLRPGGDIVLVGHSLGGAVATAVSERMPDRVRALVLLAPAGFGRLALAEAVCLPGVRAVTELLLSVGLTSRVAVSLVYRTLIANGRHPADDLLERVLDQRGSLVSAAREATMAVVHGGRSRGGFHRRPIAYDGPVVLVWGGRDRIIPVGHMAAVAAAFPQVDARVWPEMGHHPQAERPGALARLIESACRLGERVDGPRSQAA